MITLGLHGVMAGTGWLAWILNGIGDNLINEFTKLCDVDVYLLKFLTRDWRILISDKWLRQIQNHVLSKRRQHLLLANKATKNNLQIPINVASHIAISAGCCPQHFQYSSPTLVWYITVMSLVMADHHFVCFDLWLGPLVR